MFVLLGKESSTTAALICVGRTRGVYIDAKYLHILAMFSVPCNLLSADISLQIYRFWI